MDVQVRMLVIDPKVFTIMYAHYRTCWVKRLRLYYMFWG
jgi:hypothetical protein